MLISIFNGGLSTKLAPHLINSNEAVIAENIELLSGSIEPLKGLLDTMVVVPEDHIRFTKFKNAWVSGPGGIDFVEYNDALYKSNSQGVIEKSTNGFDFYELGLDKPSSKLLIETFPVEFTKTQRASAEPDEDDSDIPEGTHKYIIGYETNLEKEFKQEFEVDYDGTYGMGFYIEIGDVLTYNVYRQYEGYFYLVGTTDEYGYVKDTVYDISDKELYNSLDYNSNPDKRQYVYTYYSSTTGFESGPSEASDEISVEILKAKLTNFTAPTDPSVDAINVYRIGGDLTNFYLVEALAINSTKYTDIKTDIQVLEGTLLETTNYIKPSSNIKFLTEYNSALFGCIDATLWFSNPGTVDNWASNNWIQFPEHITGLGSTQNGLLVFSRNKTWILNGENLASYFTYPLSTSVGCITHNTISYVENNLIWLSLDGICISNGSNIENISMGKLGKIKPDPLYAEVYEQQYYLFHTEGTLIVDFRESLRFYSSSIIAVGASYDTYLDELNIKLENDTTLKVWDKGSNLPIHYKTGRMTDNGITNYKTYKNFYITIEGTLTLSIYIGGNLVLEDRQLIEGFNNIMVPQDKTKGYYVELEFKGLGKLLEIDYISEGRQNGR